MVSIIAGGDVCPMGDVEKLFMEGDSRAIFHDLQDEITGADLSIVNLECPLVSQKTPITKTGTLLSANTNCIHGFSAANWKVLNLANNHSFDQGATGLLETIQTIHHAGLSVVGAGSNIKEAETPYITKIAAQRIVLYSMAEQEYSIADSQAPGANPLDLIRCVQAIRLHKQDGVFIVFIHGGLEFYPYPSPEMVRRCRFLIDMGADAVISCHTHCPLPWETYADRPIVYGLGNLVFETAKPRSSAWHEGYLAKLLIQDGKVKLEVKPYIQSKTHFGAKFMDDRDRESFLMTMELRCRQLQDGQYLQRRWDEVCLLLRDEYLCDLFGHNRFLRKLRKFLFSKVYSKRSVLKALHTAQCEIHQEVLSALFRNERLGDASVLSRPDRTP